MEFPFNTVQGGVFPLESDDLHYMPNTRVSGTDHPPFRLDEMTEKAAFRGERAEIIHAPITSLLACTEMTQAAGNLNAK